MGFLDFLFSKKMKRHMAAKEIGVESGLFVTCPICKDITEAENAVALRPATEALVERLIQEKDPRLELFDGDARDVIETVAEVGRDLPFRCNCHNI
jgi:hypothetical protein